METILGLFFVFLIFFMLLMMFSYGKTERADRGFRKEVIEIIQEYEDFGIPDPKDAEGNTPHPQRLYVQDFPYTINRDNDNFIFVFSNLTNTLYSNQILFVFNPDRDKYKYTKLPDELELFINMTVLCYYSEDSVLCYNTRFLDMLNNAFSTNVDYHKLIKHLCSKNYGVFGGILKRERRQIITDKHFQVMKDRTYNYNGKICRIENPFPKIKLKAIRF